ncbi:HAD family hydrolase [Nonomuraea sp. NPDC026600]|uniref:HAD family hydrolase n=1 Tax=Nonomuraea sp. NPDC026600 TaxID=3155363 RepID=UPI0033E75BAE
MNEYTMPGTGASVGAIAFDYGGTLARGRIDHELGQRPVDSTVIGALRALHRAGVRLLLASNTLPGETRWPALQKANVHTLFSAALLSYPLGVAKPEKRFYDLVAAAAGCPRDRVLCVGDHLINDVEAPLACGLGAVLIRPNGLLPTEELPQGAVTVSDVAALPGLLARHVS